MDVKEPKITTPKYYEPIDGQVAYCPYCRVKFVELVAANYDYTCPACEKQFNVVKEPEEENESEEGSKSEE